jgi:hypothetical protein
MNFLALISSITAYTQALPAIFQLATALETSISSVISSVIGLMKNLEAQYPGVGKGAEKLAAVQAVLEHAFADAGKTADDFQKAWPNISASIGAIVGIFNQFKVFKSATPAAPSTTTTQ